MCSGGGSDAYAAEMRNNEMQRQWKIRQGMDSINKNFSQFDNKFFDGRQRAYMQYAMPQLEQQYGDAQRGLVYALARQGIGASSEGNRRNGQLSQDYGLQRQNVVDKSMESANETRRSIEDARSGLIQDLHNTADPAAAAKGSVARAAYLNQPAAPSPLGQLFVNTLNGLNTYQQVKGDTDAYNEAMRAYPMQSGASNSGQTYK
jgi:hypothetical protein